MSTVSLRHGAMLVLFGTFLAISPAKAADRPAAKIVADINAVEMPKVPEDRNDPAARKAFIADRQKALEKKAELIGELYRSHPEAPELDNLLVERWQVRSTGPALEETRAEVDQVLASKRSEKLRAEAGFIKVALAFQKAGRAGKAEDLLPVFEDFAAKFPQDPRGAMILASIANRITDAAQKDELMKRLVKDYPDSPVAKGMAGQRRQTEAVGKPFVLAFNDAIKGSPVSIAGLKGKVVVIDFWATWCGPCVGEMPNMKKLYAEYKDKGVEFIGVSLDSPKDQGGFDQLKSFVEKNQIDWPQFYGEKGEAGSFATEWGVNAIPTVFLVDAEGNLATPQARGLLEKLIPEYLEKAKARKSASNP